MSSSKINLKSTNNPLSVKKYIDKIPFFKIAKKCGFCYRKSKKLHPKILVIGFLKMIAGGNNTFIAWSDQISSLIGQSVSKQAINKRINPRFVEFCRRLIVYLIKDRLTPNSIDNSSNRIIEKYKNVFVNDSTSLKLPRSLNWCYPGTVSKGKLTSQLKIQTIYELKKNEFHYFALTSSRQNDQSRASDIFEVAKEGDLVLRDLGYFALESLELLTDKGIFFVSKLRYGTSIFYFKDEKKLDLLKILKRHNHFDGWVLLGEKKKIKVRLVAKKLHPELAIMRRKKAKNDRNQKANHDDRYFQLLHYSIYITNITVEDSNSSQICQLYGMRWRIESIFKCWKSYNHLQKIIPQSSQLTKERAESIILLSLIGIIMIQHKLFQWAIINKDYKSKDTHLSLFKITSYCNKNLSLILTDNDQILEQIYYYCIYERRRDRSNYYQKMAS